MFDWEKNLQSISQLYGLSGEETDVTDWIQKEISPFITRSYVNTLGSLVAVKEGTGNHQGKLMISTHTDEIGMIVSTILDGGFIRVEPRGV